MSRVEEVFAGTITPIVSSNRLIAGHNFNVIYVSLHRRRVKGKRARHAVAIVGEGDRLVLVNLAWLADAIIEAMVG